MSFDARDVIAKKEHIFKDTKQKDIKVARDCLIMIANKDGDAYYLTMSTHDDRVNEFYQRFPEQNYLLSKKKCDGLKKTSLVNLKSIYKDNPSGKLVVVIPSSEYDKLKKKFITWQSKYSDEYYNEIKDLL